MVILRIGCTPGARRRISLPEQARPACRYAGWPGAVTCARACPRPAPDKGLAHRRVVEHDLDRRMTAVQPQVLAAGGIGLHNQNALINTDAQEVAGGVACEP